MKVLTIVGTRPEVIRLACVIARLEKTVDHVLVHTGQNYDFRLNGVFFEELRLRPPKHYLGINTDSLGTVLGGILIEVEKVLIAERPDAVLILGDTNSALAAIMAKRMQIPVYHMEAGNRCFDENVPEETNRRIVDHTADFNLVYTEHARRNLLAEGLHPRRILLTGSPMGEVLREFRPQIDGSMILAQLELEPGRYFLVSAHREENVDSPRRLSALLDCLRAVRERYRYPVIVSTHPRTRKRLAALELPEGDGDMMFMQPFGFSDYNKLQLNSACTLSDSGTISEESSILGFPAVTLRESIERPEALDSGSILMTGLDPTDVLTCTDEAMRQVSQQIPPGYEILNTSLRVVRYILSTAGRHRAWAGLR